MQENKTIFAGIRTRKSNNMKTSRLNFVLSLLLVVSVHLCLSQSILKPVKPEIAKQVQGKKIIVMLYEEDPSIAKGLDASKLKAYKERITNLNAGLKMIKDLWTFNKSVVCLTPTEIRNLSSLASDYAILSITILKINDGAIIGWNNFLARMFICFPDKLDPKHPIFYQEIYSTTTDYDVPSADKIGIIAGMFRLQDHLMARAEDKKRVGGLYQEDALENHGMLGSKTLLLNKEYLDKNISDSDISTSYRYGYEVCDKSKIEQAQVTKDARYAYVYRFPVISKHEQYSHVVFDAATGKILSFSMPWGVHLNDYIDKKHLKNYWLYSDYYVNKGKAKE